MNRQQQYEQVMRETKELKSKLILTNKFNDLDVFIGDNDTYEELGSIAACVTQIDKPFIFLAHSNVLTRYRLTKKEIKAILYHELAHYKLGHTDIDHMLDTDMTMGLYIKQELDADAYAATLAIQDGLDADDAHITLAIGLAKSATYIMEEQLCNGKLPSRECMEFLEERIDALFNKVVDRDAYLDKINKFQKESKRVLTRLANKQGYRDMDELIDSIQSKPKFNIVDVVTERVSIEDMISEIDAMFADLLG
jgi:hypothetical protein